MPPAIDSRDPLFEIELRIARRADELAHETGMQGKNPLEVWCEAERQTGNPFRAEASPDFRLPAPLRAGVA